MRALRLLRLAARCKDLAQTTADPAIAGMLRDMEQQLLWEAEAVVSGRLPGPESVGIAVAETATEATVGGSSSAGRSSARTRETLVA